MSVNSPTTSTLADEVAGEHRKQGDEQRCGSKIPPADMAPGAGVEAAEGGFDPLLIAAPHQHGGSDHHEHDRRAPQREPAPGVEQVVQRLGGAAVGEDRPMSSCNMPASPVAMSPPASGRLMPSPSW